MKSNELINAQITKIINLTPRIKLFELSFNKESFHFEPGQWIDLYAPKEIVKSEKFISGYTIISTLKLKNKIELAIRESSTHPVTQLLHSELAHDLVVQITEGRGVFTLKPEMKSKKPVFIAGGIGITPLLSMCRTMNEEHQTYNLIYSASYEVDLILKDEISQNKLSHFHFLVTKEKTPFRQKRIDLEYLKEIITEDQIENSPFLICGPKEMIDDVKSYLLLLGVKSQSIHHEKWW